uniref:Uncharacterized protein n=1 Tax=Setaria digitata TaxID=48799 RepID=A0A915PMB3_9BILA
MRICFSALRGWSTVRFNVLSTYGVVILYDEDVALSHLDSGNGNYLSLQNKALGSCETHLEHLKRMNKLKPVAAVYGA